ncbi:hypothetical protein GAYE_SCF64G6697 [Galdieria yellowstonensis]|uniref:NADP-dependent oxidoreductase domain-containing protein n=1 Tax=Galdieria yellowstonensis TaxID=3028027 RepID=A0AAV9INL3_9RHOD|nr:hypothetical protein GAYE_SCF64G6697 [Galdieria yellowstonensis]
MSAEPVGKLNSGATIPLRGFGTWKAEPGVVGECVKTAYDVGYRHFDCAAIYQNEKEIGQAFSELFSRGVKRSDIFVTSKVWNTCHDPQRVVEACKQTLQDLRLDYLDLYLVHWPCNWEFTGLPITADNWIPKDKDGNIKFSKVSLEQTWHAMEEVQKMGLVKSIGVSNYSIVNMLDLFSYCKIPPAVNQIEMHPYYARTDLLEFCKSRGVHVTAYSPLGSGKHGPLQDETVAKIAKKHGRTPAQVLIRWCLQRGCSVIPKSVKKERIKENFDVLFELSPQDMKELEALDKNIILNHQKEYWGFNIHA